MLLLPGSNIFIVGRPEPIPIDLVAADVIAAVVAATTKPAEALGAQADPAGQHGGWQFYVSGNMRPLSIRHKEVTPKVLQWYIGQGAPVGATPALYTVAIDWRGKTTEIPKLQSIGSVQRGKAGWPDLPADKLSDWLTTADKSKFEQFVDAIAEGTKEAADKAASTGNAFLLGVVSSIVASLVVLQFMRRRSGL